MFNQDNLQKGKSLFIFFIDLYRIIVGTLLILSIPQICDKNICTIEESFKETYDNFLIINEICLISFITLCIIEINREYTFIKYLEVNDTKPTDKDTVIEYFKDNLTRQCYKIIKFNDMFYKACFYETSFIFFINCIISAYVIFKKIYELNTFLALTTNIILTGLKLTEVYGNISAPSGVYYSAFLVQKTQYNDIDPDFIKKNHSPRSMYMLNKYSNIFKKKVSPKLNPDKPSKSISEIII